MGVQQGALCVAVAVCGSWDGNLKPRPKPQPSTAKTASTNAFQTGEVSNAIILLDELEVTERGTPEVHAALVSGAGRFAWRSRGVERQAAGSSNSSTHSLNPRNPTFFAPPPQLPPPHPQSNRTLKAAVLWSERPSQRLRAEQQFEIASEFDRRYGDLAFVRDERHWPPRLVAALGRFLELK